METTVEVDWMMSYFQEKSREEFTDDPYRKPTQVFEMSILRRVS